MKRRHNGNHKEDSQQVDGKNMKVMEMGTQQSSSRGGESCNHPKSLNTVLTTNTLERRKPRSKIAFPI